MTNNINKNLIKIAKEIAIKEGDGNFTYEGIEYYVTLIILANGLEGFEIVHVATCEPIFEGETENKEIHPCVKELIEKEVFTLSVNPSIHGVKIDSIGADVYELQQNV